MIAVQLLGFLAALCHRSDISDPPALWDGCLLSGFVEKLL